VPARASNYKTQGSSDRARGSEAALCRPLSRRRLAFMIETTERCQARRGHPYPDYYLLSGDYDIQPDTKSQYPRVYGPVPCTAPP
jgi:hypothetical protein